VSAAHPLHHAAPAVPSDAELVARIRAGDEGGCEALYVAYHAPLWRFAYGYVRSAEIAEELVQEVFLALWRNRADWEVSGSVRAWLYGAVRNQALNHLRHERLAARVAERHAAARAGGQVGAEGADAPALAMAAPPPSAQAVAEANDLEAAVVRAIAALPERRRAAMALRWRYDLAPQEIAGVLGLTPEVVRVLLSRARRELAELLGRARG
jgi:RNA polymerase sigma-70 factor (ECF subfamily)